MEIQWRAHIFGRLIKTLGVDRNLRKSSLGLWVGNCLALLVKGPPVSGEMKGQRSL